MDGVGCLALGLALFRGISASKTSVPDILVDGVGSLASGLALVCGVFADINFSLYGLLVRTAVVPQRLFFVILLAFK